MPHGFPQGGTTIEQSIDISKQSVHMCEYLAFSLEKPPKLARMFKKEKKNPVATAQLSLRRLLELIKF